MSEVNLAEFSFSKWYPSFERDSLESIIIGITNDVQKYIIEDVMVLPKEASTRSVHAHVNTEQHYSVDWTEQDETDALQLPTFPEFSQKLKDAMNELGGQVFVKTNWKSPIDATWLVPGRTLKCTSLLDIYSLLKGSHRVAADLSLNFERLSPEVGPCVVMKEWIDLPPGCEFRCFVKSHQLIAISQRDNRCCYQHLSEQKFDILEEISKFFRKKVKGKFRRADYVFDVARLSKNSIFIIDFQPLNKNYTGGILFDWDELMNWKPQVEEEVEFGISDDTPDQEAEIGPELRYIAEGPGMMACYQPSGYPIEVSEMCSGESTFTLERFMNRPNFYVVSDNEDSDNSDVVIIE